MNYSFNLIFAKCESADDILNAYKSIKSILFDMFRKNPEPFIYPIQDAGRLSLNKSFEFKIYHWKKLKLMAVSCGKLSANFNENFKSEICFQNVSDTNYDYETYKNISPEVDEIVNEYKAVKSMDDLIEIMPYLYEYIDDDDIDEINKNQDTLDYYVKSACYTAIFNRLRIDVIAHDKKSDDIDAYTFNAITSEYELAEFWFLMQLYLNKLNGNIKKDK